MSKAEPHLLDQDPLRKPKRDLTGETFHRWNVIAYAGRAPNRDFWVCRCECGTVSTVVGNALRCGRTKSCVCCRAEQQHTRTVHGMTRRFTKMPPEYNSWRGMIQRCTNPKHQAYSDYGGRGITICDSWMSFMNFYNDVGRRPTELHTISRIDNNGPYSPTNCRWELFSQQARNRRSNVLVTYQNETLCLCDMASKFGIKYSRLRSRLRNGMAIQQAIETPF